MLALVLTVIAWIWVGPQGTEERNEFVRTAAQVGGAIFLALGLYYTHQTVENSRKTLEHQRQDTERQRVRDQEEAERHRKDHQDERFFRAVELLGNENSIDARIGAIYALEQLSKESDEYYHQIIEVLCTFIRRRSSEVIASLEPNTDEYEAAPLDIQTSVTVLGRRRMVLGDGEQKGLDLSGAYLCHVMVLDADFQGSRFFGAYLVHAAFLDCNLSHANFTQAKLMRSSFVNSILIGAFMIDTDATDSAVILAPQLPDPAARMAIFSSSGVPPLEVNAYEREDQSTEREFVNGGRYLDDSHWFDAVLNEMTFMLALSTENRTDDISLDLSGMKGVSKDQFERVHVIDGSILPTFADDRWSLNPDDELHDEDQSSQGA